MHPRKERNKYNCLVIGEIKEREKFTTHALFYYKYYVVKTVRAAQRYRLMQDIPMTTCAKQLYAPNNCLWDNILIRIRLMRFFIILPLQAPLLFARRYHS